VEEEIFWVTVGSERGPYVFIPCKASESIRYFVDQFITIGVRRQRAIQGSHSFRSHALHDKISYRKNRWYKHLPWHALYWDKNTCSYLISYKCFTWSDGSRVHKEKAGKGNTANCAFRHLCHYVFGRHPSTVQVEVAFHQLSTAKHAVTKYRYVLNIHWASMIL
jgi:hypothetical protein